MLRRNFLDRPQIVHRPIARGISDNDKQRFLAKYARATPVVGPLETLCLRWPDGFYDAGYGQFSYGVAITGYTTLPASRMAWLVLKGKIPDDLCVCHHCDNPWCVNVDHLFLGTHQDNAEDRELKGRGVPPCGESNGQAKLNEDRVLQIHQLAWSGHYSQREIGRMFGICQQQVSDIKHRQRWGHLWDKPNRTTPVLEEMQERKE
jgi:HNH endonuclease/CENP-B N-terminal DNA-binding domain